MNQKLEQLVINEGNRYPAKVFVDRYKDQGMTTYKLYAVLKKHNLPTHTDLKREAKKLGKDAEQIWLESNGIDV